VKMWIALIFLRLWAVVVMIDPDSLDWGDEFVSFFQ
jgi:hypothetical protein